MNPEELCEETLGMTLEEWWGDENKKLFSKFKEYCNNEWLYIYPEFIDDAFQKLSRDFLRKEGIL